VDEICHAASESYPAVCISDSQGRARNTFTFGGDQLEFSICRLGHAQQRHRPELNPGLNTDAESAFTVVKAQTTQERFAFGNRRVKWSIMSHEQKILIEVHRVKLGKTSATAHQVHHFHGLTIFEIPFAAARNSPCGK